MGPPICLLIDRPGPPNASNCSRATSTPASPAARLPPAPKVTTAAADPERVSVFAVNAAALTVTTSPAPLAVDVFENEQPPAEEPIASESRCSLFELGNERCRWPIGTPGAEDFCFCGNTPVDGMPYCTGHTRLAYRPGSRQRVVRG